MSIWKKEINISFATRFTIRTHSYSHCSRLHK